MKVWVATVCDGANDIYSEYFDADYIDEKTLIDYMLYSVYIEQKWPEIIHEDWLGWIEECQNEDRNIYIRKSKDGVISIYFFNLIPDIEIKQVETITLTGKEPLNHNLTTVYEKE